MLMKTMREKAADLRVTKLELVREQIENGSLVIRQMTKAERTLYPPRSGKRKRY
jgi:hypothetical protein